MQQRHIDSFLKLGYFVDYHTTRYPIDLSGIDRKAYIGASCDELISMGVDKLFDTFSKLWTPGQDDVVPLSGGLDSRIILGALLEHREARSIYTYTFGVPGSYDYDIAGDVARRIGTRHTSVPLNGISWHEDELLEVARREDCQAALFYNQPLWQIERLFGGSVLWSGFVGDAVAGSHFHDPPSPTLDAAKRRYLRTRRLVKSVDLSLTDDEELLPLIAGGNLPPEDLSWDEQVLFAEAVPKFTTPHVLWKGFDYRTPLINTPWMDFMLSVPNCFRLGQSLMIEVAQVAFPALFKMPCKNRVGHTVDTPKALVLMTFWANRVRKLAHQFVPGVNWPNHQYNDFNEEIRTRKDLRMIVRSNISDLKDRGLCDWIDFEGIWRRHDRRLRNHGDALVVLASLELVFKAREHLISRSDSSLS